VPGCAAAVRSWTVGMVRSVKVFSDGGVVAMGIVGVTTLHPRGPRNLELTPLPKAASPASEDSLKMVCKDGDPLCTIPMNMVPESSPSGQRLRLPKRLAVNSKLPK
jgi:hypothetical protein